MERLGEGSMNDYFAEDLLAKLDTADPVFASYEAQDISNRVGFDFKDFQDVVPRALDEIRETKEAYAEEGAEGREHFGDEMADIMFSLVNLARHSGMDELPTIEELNSGELEVDTEDTIAIVDAIGERISEVAEIQINDSDNFDAAMLALFQDGMFATIKLAEAHGFDPQELLKENVRKYLIRCQAIEQLALEDGKSWGDLSEGNEIVDYWKRAKSLLK